MWHHRDIEEEKIIQKILNHEMLEPEEVNYAFWEFECVDEEEGEHHRWYHVVDRIIKVENRYFNLCALLGLTECQESEYEPQIAVEVEPREKMITVREWVAIE